MEGKKSEFKAFDRVLVRDKDDERWQAAFYDQYLADEEKYPHHVISGACFTQCIPYEGHEHLLGTTDRPEKPGRWKPELEETFFIIVHVYGESFCVSELRWDGVDDDEEMYRLGNCFRTREEAQEVADKINDILKDNAAKQQ